MKPDEFEQHLQSQPLRTVPPEWRQEILSAARAASSPAPRPAPQAPGAPRHFPRTGARTFQSAASYGGQPAPVPYRRADVHCCGLESPRSGGSAEMRPHAPLSLLSTLRYQLSTLLWPHPAAWAGLAAVWLVILGINFGTRRELPAEANYSRPASRQVFMAFQEQQRLLSELLNPHETPVAERPKSAVPRPRSDLRSAGLSVA